MTQDDVICLLGFSLVNPVTMAEGESGLSSPQDGADSPHDPSFTCVLVHNIPSTYAPSDSEYITRCFREATSLTGTSLSTSDTRVVPTLTSGNATPHSANHAVITVDTSDIKGMHCGALSNFLV